MWFYSTSIATICEENGGTRFVFNLLALIQKSRSSNAFILVTYNRLNPTDWKVGIKENKK